MTASIHIGDCLEIMRGMPDKSVDLVFCSPPYVAQRDYGIGFNLTGQDWVDWAVERYCECLRVSRGVVAWVVEGAGHQTVSWDATPALMMADLHRKGVPLWKPSIYARHSVPGKFTVFRNLYEWIIVSSNGNPPAFSDPTACGEAPKFAPGGRTRPRKQDGTRNLSQQDYKQPIRTNIGNILWCGAVGGGQMGDALCHENEAPFPEWIAEVFIRSFTKPGDTVLDPFSGSGTTGKVAAIHEREFIGIDIRESQVDLTKRRLARASK